MNVIHVLNNFALMEDVTWIRGFLDKHPQASGGLLLHGGREIHRLGEKIIAAPWTAIAG